MSSISEAGPSSEAPRSGATYSVTGAGPPLEAPRAGAMNSIVGAVPSKVTSGNTRCRCHVSDHWKRSVIGDSR